MSAKPICVFARWQVREGHLDEVLTLLATVAAKSREEPGNLFYRLHQGTADRHTIVLYEGYADEAALAAHRSSGHFRDMVLGAIVPLLESREVILAAPFEAGAQETGPEGRAAG